MELSQKTKSEMKILSSDKHHINMHSKQELLIDAKTTMMKNSICIISKDHSIRFLSAAKGKTVTIQ